MTEFPKPMSRPKFYVGLSVMAACTLALQIILTRMPTRPALSRNARADQDG
jgi:hypothetical protein